MPTLVQRLTHMFLRDGNRTIQQRDDLIEMATAALSGHTPEGTAVKSTGEIGGVRFLRENGDGTCSWEDVPRTAPEGVDVLSTNEDANKVLVSQGDDSTAWEAVSVLSRTTTLTAAQLADLHNTPVELVPAPGANKLVYVTPPPIAVSMDAPANCTGGGIMALFYDSAYPLFYGAAGDEEGFAAALLTTAGDNVGTGGSVGALNGAGVDQYSSLSQLENLPITLRVTAPFFIPGAIVTTSIGAAGTGYVIADTISIGDAVLTIDTVGGGGEVLTYTLTDAGTNNILGNLQATTTSGSGVNFTLDIDSLDYSVNPMELKIKVLYSIFDIS